MDCDMSTWFSLRIHPLLERSNCPSYLYPCLHSIFEYDLEEWNSAILRFWNSFKVIWSAKLWAEYQIYSKINLIFHRYVLYLIKIAFLSVEHLKLLWGDVVLEIVMWCIFILYYFRGIINDTLLLFFYFISN